MTVDWTPVFILPNIQLPDAIECDFAALAPADDQRVRALKRAQPMFRRFLGRFADNFGEKFEPAVLLLRADTPPNFLEIEALASFRDLIAISVIAYNRALELHHPRGLRVLFGEAFAIYPWMLDKGYEDLIGNTPAILGVHEVAKFKGQSSPSVFRMSLDPSSIDRPLLTTLMERWRRRYGADEPVWTDIALFRSINMAYHASLLPCNCPRCFWPKSAHQRKRPLYIKYSAAPCHRNPDQMINFQL